MTTPHRVALVRCADYDEPRVEAAVRRSIDLLGGIDAFVKPGQRVLLKPNLLRAMEPDRAATTHPAVVAAVARLVAEAGARAVIADSPGGPFLAPYLRTIYRKTGMSGVAESTGAELNENVDTCEVSHPGGIILRRLDLIKLVQDTDVVINVAKFKTHNLTTLTLAVKNLFGLVPGVLKVGYHSKMRDPQRFCAGLVDIYSYVRPTLNLIDAVVGMEGNGPSGGDARPMGVLIAADDALAADIVGAALVGLDPCAVKTTQVAREHGLTSGRLEDIELLGDPLDELIVRDFRMGAAAEIDPGLVPRRLLGLIRMGEASGEGGERKASLARSIAAGWFGRQLVVLPRAGENCTGCSYCAKHCPVDAITIENGKAHMDPAKCIRCYCCHELCPHLAVELERPWLGRLLMGR